MNRLALGLVVAAWSSSVFAHAETVAGGAAAGAAGAKSETTTTHK